MKQYQKLMVGLTLGLFGVGVATAAQLRLHNYYTDNMVLQRDKPVLIKGWADAGKKVAVSFSGQTKSGTADDKGMWSVSLAPMAANAAGQKLTVKSGAETVALDQVLVGDVLVFARQSSIDVSLGRTSEGKKAAEGFKANPQLRAIRIKTIPAKEPQSDLVDGATAGWMQIDSKNALSMSATAFYLGRDLSREIGVPLGIVDIDMGSHFAAGWLSEAGLDESATRFPEQKDLPWYRKELPPRAEAWESGELARQRDEYFEKMKQRGAAEKPSLGLAPLEFPYYPSAGYNAVIHPLRGMAAKGLLLQLGNDYPLVTYAALRASGKITNRTELDRAWPQAYGIIKNANRMTPATLPLVPSDWRRAFGDEALPVGMINPPGSDFFDYALHNREIRELLRRTQKSTEGMGLIAAGTEHIPLSGQPADDQLLAKRCRHWVLGDVYGKNVTSSGPLLARVDVGFGEATVHFQEGTADGLSADGAALEAFEVAGPDKEFVPCTASIEGNTVKLESDDVAYIQFVRYNWSPKPDQGLVNGAGLPAVPFNTLPDWEYNWWPPAPEVELPAEYQTTADEWPRRDVAIINGALNPGGSGDSEVNPRWIGPTGIFSDDFGPNIHVHYTESGSPADGKVLPGDVIYGVNGKNFGDDTYRELANAITYSESKSGKGKLALSIRRQGELINVDLQLEVLGSYSSTTPYFCRKSDLIVERAEKWLSEKFRPTAGQVQNNTGFLDSNLYFLLASGNPEHQGLVRRVIYEKLARMTPLNEPDPNKGAHNWHLGYTSMLLGEYYHATGDRNVLPYLKNQVDWAAVTQIKPPTDKEVPWEVAHYDDVIGGWRQKYNPTGADRWKSGYGLMPHAGMACVMGMLLAKEAGLEIDELALERGLTHFNKGRAEYGYVLYWYHPVRLEAPKPIDPIAETNGKLWSMNGKLGTAAALFKVAGYPDSSEICSRYCVYGYNNTRHGHGGMFFNNFWTPVGAYVSGEQGFKHFMKGQTWWRELFRRHDGSFTQAGRGGIGVAYGLPYVAAKERLRMLGAPRSVFGGSAPDYLAPALEAHRKRDYALAGSLIRKEMKERIIPAEDLPVVEHTLRCVQTLRESVEHDLSYAEELIKQGKHYYANFELSQLKGVVAADNPRLKAIAEALKSREGKALIAASKKQADVEQSELNREQDLAQKAARPAPKASWVCLMTQSGNYSKDGLGQVAESEATRWRMKVLEEPEQAPKGWNEPRFDDGDWNDATLPVSWRVSHTALFRGKFNLADKKAFNGLRFRAYFFRQQNVEIYINGELVAKVNNIANANVDHELTDYAMEVARDGENTLAIITRHAKRWGKVKGDFCGVNGGGFGFRLDARKKE